LTSNGDAHSGFRDEHGLVPTAYSIMPMNSGKDYKARQTDVAQPLMAGGPVGGNQGGDFIAHQAAFPINTQLGLRGADTSNSSREGLGLGNEGDPSFTLQAAHSHAVATQSAVRRLTPRECERLQGFPDDYTLVPHRNKPMSDGPRYKALGNSMAVPVMRWIGERIQMVQKLRDESE
jgi:DNA (cytosine-5)-methyltransferase 1